MKPDNILLMAGKYYFEDLVLADFGAGRKIAEEGSCDAGGCVMPRLSIGRDDNNVGRTAADHVSIEMCALADLFSPSVQAPAAKKWRQNDKTLLLKFSERVAGDVGKFVSQYIIDENSDTCK